MTPTDWSSDHNIPATVSAPDLFGGELFGDELMDMYNSDAVVGTTGDVATGKCGPSCLSLLLCA